MAGRRKRHDAWNATRRTVFLETLRLSANVSYAAATAGMERSGAYRLRERDPAFRAAWEAAIEESMDDLLAALLDRAKNGSNRTVYDAEGKVLRTVHSYSDALGMRLLAHYRPSLHRRAVEEKIAAAVSEAVRATPRVHIPPEAFAAVDLLLARE